MCDVAPALVTLPEYNSLGVCEMGVGRNTSSEFVRWTRSAMDISPWPHWPDWEMESAPDVSDLTMLPLFALSFPVIRFCLNKFLFDKLGRKYITGIAQSSKLSVDEVEANQKKLVKFKESAWKCVYYLTAEVLSLLVTVHEPWFTNTKYFWVGPSNQGWPDPLMTYKTKLKGLYGFAGGFYLYSIFALLFWETRRSDFGVSMSHHVATLMLIIVSYVCKFARIGSVILAVHDASDVFLEIGKLTKYSGFVVLPSIAFVLFAISWLILRLIIFPFVIIRSACYEALKYVDLSKVVVPVYYYVFNVLLITLLVMHIYWWILIWRMIMKLVQDRGKISDDVRSDSDSDSDEDEDGKDKTD